jgi:peptidoglycan-N-acetylglucosamine deacetylase
MPHKPMSEASHDGTSLSSVARKSARAIAGRVVPTSLLVMNGPDSPPKPEVRRSGGRRRVALTFDDGPDELTPEYLATLKQFDVQATFFLVGDNCARYPEHVRALADAGHELAGHGYTHRRFSALSARELRAELERTQALLPASPRERPLVRPPHGSLSLPALFTCARAGFTIALWSYNSGDWCTDRADVIARTFRDRPPEDGAIVLLHEGQRWTLEALPAVIGSLRDRGYELCTVGELFD